jgi:hypothetical protein
VAELDGPDAPGSVARVDFRSEPERGSTGFTVA